ncbi:hypothetical protein EJ08DRAFT_657141 [Tothia fuscella]|uniref:Uncharacterized protein n=1 Tax=Tothia fuscella TaxID=1048955 RepID=A0A9P4NZ87_9PEZI|nr:hypothetical protein EJ08DRAFT_657141 [Tothia fuscella]
MADSQKVNFAEPSTAHIMVVMNALGMSLAGKPELLGSADYQRLFHTVLSKYIRQRVGQPPGEAPKPQEVRLRKNCHCSDCAEFDKFLADQRRGIFELTKSAPSRLHLEERIISGIAKETVEGRTPYTLKITKFDSAYIQAYTAWKLDRDHVQAYIQSIGKETLQRLLGQHFEEIWNLTTSNPISQPSVSARNIAPGPSHVSVQGVRPNNKPPGPTAPFAAPPPRIATAGALNNRPPHPVPMVNPRLQTLHTRLQARLSQAIYNRFKLGAGDDQPQAIKSHALAYRRRNTPPSNALCAGLGGRTYKVVSRDYI